MYEILIRIVYRAKIISGDVFGTYASIDDVDIGLKFVRRKVGSISQCYFSINQFRYANNK